MEQLFVTEIYNALINIKILDNNTQNLKKKREFERKKNFLSSEGINIDDSIYYYGFSDHLKKNIENYKICAIKYTLNSNCIQSLEVIYKSRKNGSLEIINSKECLIDNQDQYVIEIPDSQEVKLLRIEEENKKDIGFTIECGNQIYEIGCKNVKPKQTFENQILLGIEIKANPSFGISNLTYKCIDSKKYAMKIYIGFLQLRAKLKKNLVFRQKIFDKIKSYNQNQKFIVEICDLPDIIFYNIMKDLLLI